MQAWKLITNYANQRGLVAHHVNSYNQFADKTIREIVKANADVKSQTNPHFLFRWESVDVKRPCVLAEGARELTPHECRLRRITYSAPIMAKVSFRLSQDDKLQQAELRIGNIPVMLRSNRCVLSGLTLQEQQRIDEDSTDPGGYFIVNGTEKVLLMVEQTAANRIIVTKEDDNIYAASITSDTHERKSRCQIVLRDRKFYLEHNTFGKNKINLIVVMKAMGVTNDQQIVQLIGTDGLFQENIGLTMYEASELGIFTQRQALAYLSTLFAPRAFKLRKSLLQEALDCLATVILCHIPVIQRPEPVSSARLEDKADVQQKPVYNFRPKIVFVAEVVRRLCLTAAGILPPTDRDFYGNKRLECAGDMIALLFEDAFKSLNFNIQKLADDLAKKPRTMTAERFVDPNKLTMAITSAISSGNITLDRFKYTITGASQVVSRFCHISALGQMTRLTSSFDKSLKAVGPRMLNASQWGICCPSDTPEGESVGLIKNLAIMAEITQEEDADQLKKLILALGVEDILLVDFSTSNFYQVFLNGFAIGIHSNPGFLLDQLRKLRRRGKIPASTSLNQDKATRTINIACDGGRPCRPLIIIDGKKSLVTDEDIHKVVSREISVRDLVRQGKIELIDVNEELNLHIAFGPNDLQFGQYTHMELDPLSIYGVVGALVPFPHHNQSPRNVFQCAMGKQALGVPGLNVRNRFDTVLFECIYPQVPLVSSKVTRYSTHYMEVPAGQNAIIAVTSFSGYDIEDAIVMNRASCDRGYGRATVTKCTEADLEVDAGDRLAGLPVGMREQREDITLKHTPETYGDCQTFTSHADPFKQTGEYQKHPEKHRLADQFRRFHALDSDGLAQVGSKVEDGDVIVNRINGDSQVPVCAKLPPTDAATVSRVLISQGQAGKINIRTMLRETRLPYYGDKFSSRHGQKGTVGLIVSQCDMPFSPITGMVPDQIMNPHGFPSRMTIGKMLELITGKRSVLEGKGADGTLFQNSRLRQVCQELLGRGFNYGGKEVLVSGITGLPCRSYVFEGPIFYQRLKHMVNDKMHARSTGPKAFLTRQPLEGRAKDGGLRLGEMEKDCFVAYGTAALLNERMVASSDEFITFVCDDCGVIGYENWCQYCKAGQAMVKIKMPYAAKLMAQELLAMGILMRIGTSK